jgi:hypothetical protein
MDHSFSIVSKKLPERAWNAFPADLVLELVLVGLSRTADWQCRSWSCRRSGKRSGTRRSRRSSGSGLHIAGVERYMMCFMGCPLLLDISSSIVYRTYPWAVCQSKRAPKTAPFFGMGVAKAGAVLPPERGEPDAEHFRARAARRGHGQAARRAGRPSRYSGGDHGRTASSAAGTKSGGGAAESAFGDRAVRFRPGFGRSAGSGAAAAPRCALACRASASAARAKRRPDASAAVAGAGHGQHVFRRRPSPFPSRKRVPQGFRQHTGRRRRSRRPLIEQLRRGRTRKNSGGSLLPQPKHPQAGQRGCRFVKAVRSRRVPAGEQRSPPSSRSMPVQPSSEDEQRVGGRAGLENVELPLDFVLNAGPFRPACRCQMQPAPSASGSAASCARSASRGRPRTERAPLPENPPSREAPDARRGLRPR